MTVSEVGGPPWSCSPALVGVLGLLLDGAPDGFVLGLSDSMGTGGKSSPPILACGLSGVDFDLRRGFSRICTSSTCGGLRPEFARLRGAEGSGALTSCGMTGKGGRCDVTSLAARGGWGWARLLLKIPIGRRESTSRWFQTRTSVSTAERTARGFLLVECDGFYH
jgi:hypothetical protein